MWMTPNYQSLGANLMQIKTKILVEMVNYSFQFQFIYTMGRFSKNLPNENFWNEFLTEFEI
jgi:hypothetical protein